MGSRASLLEQFGRRLRVGMVGGGIGSYIGETHRIALRADGLYELVAGAFSRDPEVSKATGRSLLLDPARTYDDHRQLIGRESDRPDRVDAVIVATLPSSHLEIASALLAAGFHVICEKPLAGSLAEAAELQEAVRRSGRHLLLTHCYSGYPMVRLARELVARGGLGEVQIVDVAFASGAYARVPAPGEPTPWRIDAGEIGAVGMLADIGSHAFHIGAYVSGREVTEVAASLDLLGPRRDVFDNAFVNARLERGAAGRFWSTYQAAGFVHGLRFTVIGDEGSVTWDHEDAERMWLRSANGHTEQLTKAGAGATPGALATSRFTAGHPDGYGLAFANLYRDFAELLITGDSTSGIPDAGDGVRTLALVEAAVASHEANHAWVAVPEIERSSR